MAIDFGWLVVVVLVMVSNQLPAAGSRPVADTNKWQKWGGFVSQTLEACGCRRVGQSRRWAMHRWRYGWLEGLWLAARSP